MMKGLYSLFVCLFLSISLFAQKTIRLDNPSFEDFPRHGQTPENWYDCGFENESPPDIHPQAKGGQFGVTTLPMDGNTYLGMVVRDIETWEAVGQQLSVSMKERQCYDFSLVLARSLVYNSFSRKNNNEANYSTPVVIRIWGGNDYCDKAELLGETPEIVKTSWQEYTFSFMPLEKVSHILIEAYFEVPLLFPYNGNVLVDNASAINLIDCNANDTLINQKAVAGTIYPTAQIAIDGLGKTMTQSITIEMNPNQTIKSLVGELPFPPLTGQLNKVKRNKEKST